MWPCYMLCVQDTGNPLQHLVNALQSDSMANTELYMHYTPSTPAPHNINCYVEVPTVSTDMTVI